MPYVVVQSASADSLTGVIGNCSFLKAGLPLGDCERGLRILLTENGFLDEVEPIDDDRLSLVSGLRGSTLLRRLTESLGAIDEYPSDMLVFEETVLVCEGLRCGSAGKTDHCWTRFDTAVDGILFMFGPA